MPTSPSSTTPPSIHPTIPNEIWLLIANYLPQFQRIYTFSLLNGASYQLLRTHSSRKLNPFHVLHWESIQNRASFQEFSMKHTRLGRSQLLQAYDRVIPQFYIDRVNLYDSHRENRYLLEHHLDQLRSQVRELSLTWNHPFLRFSVANTTLFSLHREPQHPELDWFDEISVLKVLIRRHSHQATPMGRFWDKVQQRIKSPWKLQQLHIHLSFEKSCTLEQFCNETPEAILSQITHLQFFPQEGCYSQLTRMPHLKEVRIPSFHRDRHSSYSDQIVWNDLEKISCPHLRVVIEVTHPWSFQLKDLAEYFHRFPHLNRNCFHLQFMSNKPRSKEGVSLQTLSQELSEGVPCPSVRKEMLLQLEKMHQHYTGQNKSKESSDMASEQNFHNLLAHVKQRESIEGVYPCVMEYFRHGFQGVATDSSGGGSSRTSVSLGQSRAAPCCNIQ